MHLEIKTAPSCLPVTLAEVKEHSRLLDGESDYYLRALILLATEQAEGILCRRLLPQTWLMYLDEWPDGDFIRLPFGQLQSVSSITYLDTDASATVMGSSTYVVETGDRARIILGYNQTWPTASLYPASPIYIEFVCGYYPEGSPWAPGTPTLGAYIHPTTPNGLAYAVTTSGASGATEPTWSRTIGGTVTDGSAVYTCMGKTVPEGIKAAIKIMIADLYDNRDTYVTGTNFLVKPTIKRLLGAQKFYGEAP